MATSNIRAAGPIAAHAHNSSRTAVVAAPLWPTVLLLYATLLPIEMHVSVAGQNIYPTRMVLLVCLPWLLTQILKARLRVHLADLGIFAGCAWMMISFSVYYGFAEGFPRSAALVLDILLPYLIARLTVHSCDDLRRLLIWLAPGIFLAGTVLIFESVTHVTFVKPMVRALFGHMPAFVGGEAVTTETGEGEIRLGLLRASGGFPHPILAGLYLVASLAIYASSSIRGWPFWCAVVGGICAVFTVSSTAFASLLLFIGLTAYDRLQKVTSFLHWRLLIIGVVLASFVVEFATQSGIVNLVIRMSLNPQTGRYRRLIWEYGSLSVEKHPWFGIGFTSYDRLPWMVASIDNYWMLLAVRHGFLVPVCFFLSVIATIWLLSSRSLRQNERDRRLFVGLAIALFIVALLIFTVALFGGVTAWFFALLGMSLSLAIGQTPALAKPQRRA